MPFVASILFVVGLQTISVWTKNKAKFVRTGWIITIFLILMGIYAWPMFTGKMFGSINNPAFVEIPDSIKKADELIRQQNRDGRILHLPLARAEDVRYYWKQGYSGLNPNGLLFTSLPSISHGFNLDLVDDALTALSLIFHKPYSANYDQALELLQAFNVRFLVLHKDMEWRGGNLYDPAETEEILSKLPFIDKKAEFDDLIVYQIKDESYRDKIIVTDNVQLAFLGKNSFVWPWLAREEKGNFISPVEESFNESILSRNNELIILPKTSFLSDESIKSASLIDQLQNIRNALIQNGEIQSEKLIGKIILADQKLTENLIKDYERLIEEIFSKDIHTSRLLLYINESTFSAIFKQHLSILEQIKAFEAASSLRKSLIKNNLLPIYPAVDGSNSTNIRHVFKFKIPVKSTYEILMTDSQSKDAYINNLSQLNFQINGENFLLEGKADKNFVSFGEVEFNTGEYEVSYTPAPSLNRASISEVIKISSDGQSPSFLSYTIDNTSGQDIYQMSFESMVSQGNGFYIQLEQDNDTLNQAGQKIFQLNQFIPQENLNQWQSYSFALPALRLTTRNAKVHILVTPSPQSFFSHSNSILIKNVKIERFLNNNLLLRSRLSNQLMDGPAGEISEINQKNPTKYFGRIKILRPSFIIFKEAFHSGWKLELISADKHIYLPDKDYISNLYGNAWYIDKTGEYNFTIEFEPQENVSRGIVIASITWMILLLLCFKKYVKT